MKNEISSIRSLKTQCSCLDEENKQIWIFSNEINALFKYDINKKNISFEAINEKEAFVQDQLYNKMIAYEDNLYFFPIYAKSMGVYNVAEKKFRTIALPYRENVSYYNIIYMRDYKVLLYPVIYQKYAYIFNFKTEQIECKELDYGSYTEQIMKCKVIGSGKVESKVYFSFGTSTVIEYDIYNNNISFIHTKIEYDLLNVVNDNDEFIAVTKDGCRVFSFINKVISNEIIIDDRINKERELNDMQYIITDKYKDRYYAIPIESGDLKYIEKGKIFSINIDWDKMEGFQRHSVNNVVHINNSIMYLPYKGNYAFFYDFLTQKSEYIDFALSREIVNEVITKYPDIINSINLENKFFDLKTWIDNI